MKRKKRHHYVPEFYLRRFADADGRIERLELATGERKVISTKDAAVEVDFYTVEIGGKKSDLIENRIQVVDDLAAKALQNVDEGSGIDIDTITGLCNFVALQITRGRDFRDKLTAFHTDVQRKIDQLATARPAAEPPSEMHPNLTVLAMMDSAAALVQGFVAMPWRLVSFPKPAILTSDAPVVRWEKGGQPFYGTGVATADQISLPISPTKALILFPQLEVTEHPDTAELPNNRDLIQRTADAAHRWLFATPGWFERFPMTVRRPATQ